MNQLRPNDSFRPFSNGSEWLDWLANNCERGRGGCRNYKPDAETSRNGCPIEVALARASIGSGEIKAKIGLRGGFLEPGPRGLLTQSPPCTHCPEYRGYDEPDDRPRRGPRPPKGQEDLLDPRNTSRTCPECGAVDPDSRKGPRFACTACEHTDDADVNAARNILALARTEPSGANQQKIAGSPRSRAAESSLQAHKEGGEK